MCTGRRLWRLSFVVMEESLARLVASLRESVRKYLGISQHGMQTALKLDNIAQELRLRRLHAGRISSMTRLDDLSSTEVRGLILVATSASNEALTSVHVPQNVESTANAQCMSEGANMRYEG